MRTFLGGLLTLIAMVAVVLAVPSMWLQARLIDEQGFASTVTPMASNPQVKDYLVGQVASAVQEQTGSAVAGQVAQAAARSYADTAQFRADFVDLATQQHAWLFNPPPADADRSVMQFDITAMVNRVIAQIGVGARVSGPILVPLDHAGSGLEAGRYHDIGRQITSLAYVSTVIAVVAALLALLFARGRSSVLAWLGVGVLLAAAVSWAGGIWFTHRAQAEVAGVEDAGRAVADAVVNGAVDDLHHVLLIVAAVGAGMMVVGLLARAITGRQYSR